jgi:hypothetical protein
MRSVAVGRAAAIFAAGVLFLTLALAAAGAHGPISYFNGGPLRVAPGFTGDPTSSDRPCIGPGAPAVCAPTP